MPHHGSHDNDLRADFAPRPYAGAGHGQTERHNSGDLEFDSYNQAGGHDAASQQKAAPFVAHSMRGPPRGAGNQNMLI